MTRSQQYIALGARVLMTFIFFYSGISKITGWEGTSKFMAAQGMPLVPLFLVGAIALNLVGGLSVLLGYRARWGAVLLVAFLVPTTFIFHDFWALEGSAASAQVIQFVKNLSLLGGLLMVIAFGAGPLSFDGRRERACGAAVISTK